MNSSGKKKYGFATKKNKLESAQAEMMANKVKLAAAKAKTDSAQDKKESIPDSEKLVEESVSPKKSTVTEESSADAKNSSAETTTSKDVVKDVILEVSNIDSTKTSKNVGSNDETIKIELDNLVELDGKYYRGVQAVSKELSKELLDLDKKITKEKI